MVLEDYDGGLQQGGEVVFGQGKSGAQRQCKVDYNHADPQAHATLAAD